MMKRIVAIMLAACLCVGTLTGCSTKKADESGDSTAGNTEGASQVVSEKETQAASTEASQLDKLVFTYVTSPLNMPTIVEKEKGIFTESFADMGIAVEYAELTSGADQTQALASGDVQVLYAVGATSVILSAANGADIKVLNMYSRSPKAFCLYAKDDSLTSPESLKGKTVAGPVGTTLHELLVAYLDTAGMTIEDVNFVNMSIPDAMAGLEGGSVDVAMIAGPTAYQADQQGLHLVTDGEGLIDASIAVAVTDEFYQVHPEIIQALTDAQNSIAVFLEENKEEAVSIAAQVLDLETTAVEEMMQYYDFSTAITEEDKAGFQKTADFMLESGMIESAVDVNTLFYE